MINAKIPYYIIYSMLVAVSLAFAIASAVNSFYTQPKPAPIVVKKVTEKTIDKGALSLKVIEKNIFKLETKPAQAIDTNKTSNSDEPLGNDTPPPPPFNATLIGLIMGLNNVGSIAVIKVDADTYVLREGAEKDGLKLRSVAQYSVIISKDGKNYTLELLRDKSVLAESGKTNKPTTPVAKPDEPATSTGANINISINRAEVEEELKDLNKILQSALVSPYYEGGEFQGYRLARMRDDSPLKNLGLAAGDVITRINGSDLKSPELLFNMLSQLDDISAIAIDMVRNNEKKTLFVEIQ